MENLNIYLYVIILLLIVLIILAIIVLVGIIFLYFNKIATPKDLTNDKKSSNSNTFYCTNHPDTHSVGICMICQKSFCAKCLCDHDRLNFCHDHLKLYLENEWQQLETILTEPNKPEKAMILYDFKKIIWDKENKPSYVVTHYKINFQGDYIESFVSLYVKKQDGYEMTKRLASFKETYHQQIN